MPGSSQASFFDDARSGSAAAPGLPTDGAPGVGPAAATPMMAQFSAAKRQHPDCLLFFRMGDFFELFGEDAVVASRELGIALTSRSKGEDALPMAGVPHKSHESYLIKLVRKGYKVALCEQLEDPRHAKGIVERGVVRVVTPGTLTEEEALAAREHNFIAALAIGRAAAGLAWCDISTGRFCVAELAAEKVADELARLAPAELLASPGLAGEQGGPGDPGGQAEVRAHAGLARELARLGTRVTEREPWRFEREGARRALMRHLGVATLAGFGLSDESPAVGPAGALLEYLQETQKSACGHVRRLERVEPGDRLALDRATRSTLELVQTQRGETGTGTLLAAIDATQTPMGARLLREWLLAPLARVEPILRRQRGVSELARDARLLGALRTVFAGVRDVERLCAKVSTGRAHGRDLAALADSLAAVPSLRAQLANATSLVLHELRDALDPLDDVVARIRRTLIDAPPLAIKEGGLVRAGFDKELDELRQIAGDGKSWMARFQADEIARTGIHTLKVGFNSVFGYYIEITHAQAEKVPPHYIRKQTVKNAERYITPELKEFESKVLKSEELARDLEHEIFLALREEVARQAGRILDTAAALAELDVLCGLAHVAARNRYAPPTIDDSSEIAISAGRHPVIELSPACPSFVPNDTRLDGEARRLSILTGPNMAGKSTYIRQTALVVLLAQIGSWVPAREARIGVVDRIFTRVGAGDDISRGESTFMVEMVEIANILNNATPRSLVILDEVGRGTSTFDGLALAWAIAEELSQRTRARTLFATHYHQMVELAARFPGIVNQSVAVREWGEEIVFLHQIVEGGTDKSFGIHVARLAGVPRAVVERAKHLLRDLEEDAAGLAPRLAAGGGASEPAAALFDGAGPPAGAEPRSSIAARPHPIEERLRALDLDRLTPIEALLELRRLSDLVS